MSAFSSVPKDTDTAQNDVNPVPYPGKINWTGEIRGHYSGTKCVQFDRSANKPLADQINEFFEANPNQLVVGLFPIGDAAVIMFYTATLTPEEIEKINRFGREIRAKMAEEEAKAEEMKQENKIKVEKAVQEQNRLADVGKTCESNHGAIMDEYRDLKARVKKLEKAGKK